MDSWRMVWREGVAPQLSTAGLEALLCGLRENDPALVQGSTTAPPPVQCMQECGVEGACAIGYAAWMGDGLETVGAVEEFFARVCFEADQALGEPAGCRRFLNWFDDTPREEVRRLLSEEIERTLAQRRNESGEKVASDGIAAA
jgi:hypothetical protein